MSDAEITVTDKKKQHDRLFLRRDFDREREENLRKRREEAERRRKAEQEARQYIYKQKDLDSAVHEAYEKGKKDGYDAALQDQNHIILKLFQQMEVQFKTLIRNEHQRTHDVYVNTAQFALDAFQALSPEILDHTAQEKLIAFCASQIQERQDKESISISVAEGMKAPTEAWLNSHDCQLPKTVRIVETPTLSKTQAVCDWGEGGCLHDLEALQGQIVSNLRNVLAGIKAEENTPQATDMDNEAAALDESLGDQDHNVDNDISQTLPEANAETPSQPPESAEDEDDK